MLANKSDWEIVVINESEIGSMYSNCQVQYRPHFWCGLRDRKICAASRAIRENVHWIPVHQTPSLVSAFWRCTWKRPKSRTLQILICGYFLISGISRINHYPYNILKKKNVSEKNVYTSHFSPVTHFRKWLPI